MNKKLVSLVAVVVLAGPMTANATLIDFDSGVPAGVSLGGQMTWNSTGGGHIFMEQYNEDDFLYFSSPTTVNSFQMNSSPWEGFGYPTSGSPWLVDVAAFDARNNSLWSTTLDLTGYFAWNQWLTVDVGVYNVSSMTFYSPYNKHGVGFWPSIDNMAINEAQQVPEPATLGLLSLGLVGLGLASRRRRNSLSLPA